MRLTSAFDIPVYCDEQPVASVHDLIVDRRSWRVRYAVLSLLGGAPGQLAVVPFRALAFRVGETPRFFSALSADELRRAPPVDYAAGIGREQEQAIHNRYHWAPYWLSESVADPAEHLGVRALLGAEVAAHECPRGRIEDVILEIPAERVTELEVRPGETAGSKPAPKLIRVPPASARLRGTAGSLPPR